MLGCSWGCRNPGPLQERSFVGEHYSTSTPHKGTSQQKCPFLLLLSSLMQATKQRYSIILSSSPKCYSFFSLLLRRKSLNKCINLFCFQRQVVTSALFPREFPHRIICYFCSSALLRECPSRHSALLL